VAAFLPARICDSYVDGAGASEASVASLVPLKGQRGTREVAEASVPDWSVRHPYYRAKAQSNYII
jgi:hypothetical protein